MYVNIIPICTSRHVYTFMVTYYTNFKCICTWPNSPKRTHRKHFHTFRWACQCVQNIRH